MKYWNQKDIEQLVDRFEACTLTATAWTHHAHLIVSVWYCHRRSSEEALNILRSNIKRFNEATGTPNSDSQGYHETITRFWIWQTKRFLSSRHTLSIEENCNAFIQSDMSKAQAVLAYFSPALLFSTQARRDWVAPDLKKLHPLTFSA